MNHREITKKMIHWSAGICILFKGILIFIDDQRQEAIDFLAQKIGEVASTQDAVEGITAFIEKRDPVFTGK